MTQFRKQSTPINDQQDISTNDFYYQKYENKWKQSVAVLTVIKPQEEMYETQMRLDICKNPGTRDVKGICFKIQTRSKVKTLEK